MARDIFKKGNLADDVVAAPLAPPTAVPERSRTRTAPGTMAGFLVSRSDAHKEAEQLRERLKIFEGADAARKLDPKVIRRSRWANRHEASYAGAAYESLRDDIRAAGGNVQPIKVRPVVPGEPAGAPGAEFEIVFGHRRHAACLELGLPVLAVVSEVSDLELFAEMDRENRARSDLSPFEQGRMYEAALEAGLFKSVRQLAADLGVSHSAVSKCMTVSQLPGAILAAFPSPLEVQYRWAKEIGEVQQRDPDGLLQRANEIRDLGKRLGARAVLQRLVGRDEESTSVKRVSGKKGMATLTRDRKGRLHVSLEGVAPAMDRELESLLRSFLA